MQEYRFSTESASATQAFAERFASQLQSGDVVALVGDLAAGKTTLVQGMAAYFKVEEYASSPTFTYINEYHGRNGDLIHIDAYRLKSGEELISMGLWEYLDSDAVIVIEWADIVQSVLPTDCIHIRLLADEANREQRHITIRSARKLDLES